MFYWMTVTVLAPLLGSDCHLTINRSRNNQEKPENRGAGVARTSVFGDPFVNY